MCSILVLFPARLTRESLRGPQRPTRARTGMLRSRWHVAIAVLAASWLAVLCLYQETAISMAAAWYRSGTFGHGFAILPISLYVIWTRRASLSRLAPSANHWALLLLPLIGVAWLIGNRTDVLVLQQLALVAGLQVLAWAVLGTRVSRAMLFPLAFLFFAVPIGEELVAPMQDFTAYFTAHALRWSGILVSWQGRVLFTPTGEWHVAEACSGIRYLIPAVVLGCLFSALTFRTWSRRVGFVVLCIIMPVLANGVRAYGIIMLAHVTSNRIAVGVDHQIYGWFFFGVVMYPLFTWGGRWREPSAQPPPVLESPSDVPWSARAVGAMACVGVLLLAMGPAAARVWSADAIEPVTITAKTPSVQLPWRAVDGADVWKPIYRGPVAEVAQTYRSNSGDVGVYIGYYATEQQGAELVNSMNRLDSKSWFSIHEGPRAIVVDGQPLRVRETVLRSSEGAHRVVWSWYWVADELTSIDLYAKLLQAKVSLLGGPTQTAVIAITSAYDPAATRSTDLLQDLLNHCAPWRETLNEFRDG